MDEYSNSPPLSSFIRTLRESPTTADLFIALWQIKGESNQISLKCKDIKKNFLISTTLFRNQLIAMERAELLTFKETKDFFLIHFSLKHEN